MHRWEKMDILRYTDLVAIPWKNGGGVTREIARHDRDGQLVWRLSIADVVSEGPFSAFPGLQRILTVIEGEGMVLERPDRTAIAATRFDPIAFSGDDAINGLLPHGPCRDFNVIWNAVLAKASVTFVHGPQETPNLADDEILGVLCLRGPVQLPDGQALSPFDFAFPDAHGSSARMEDDSMALLICIKPISKS